MRHFAEQGYHAARIEDLSAQLDVAKGSIFQYFESKAGLFLEAYKKAVRAFPTYLDCPSQIREKGFSEILHYWLLTGTPTARRLDSVSRGATRKLRRGSGAEA